MPLIFFSNLMCPIKVTSLLAWLNQPFWLSWLGQLAGIFDGAHWINKQCNGIILTIIFVSKLVSNVFFCTPWHPKSTLEVIIDPKYLDISENELCLFQNKNDVLIVISGKFYAWFLYQVQI
jgi:hypothetical protein